ncbi:ANTAR domain-containing protein [Cryobacterium sp. SO2]|uniref:ANTAR domain-containing protein n=1 Tax=Cryobacterium sp. SO2 TaxID=1897060 RepID=UPI00223CDF86|nr:ANTAR domain-containing protein [Cryobacterium sp. SO2]WEO76025.1 ANTAR domain-containing protein [Cryobacterium sp. SO2]
MTDEAQKQFEKSPSWDNPQVHQATGVIVAQTNASPNEALGRLIGYAESTDASVDQVAADILAYKIAFT